MLYTIVRLPALGLVRFLFRLNSRGGEDRAGAGMLALLSGTPVVAAYIMGTGRAWPKGRMLPRPGRVRVHFGKPMQFEREAGSDRKGQYAAVSREMMAAIAALKEAAEEDRSNMQKEEPV